MATALRESDAAPQTRRDRDLIFSSLLGLCILAILLQGLWAGIFLQQENPDSWIRVHARGGEVAIALAALAAVAAFVRMRHRVDLWAGSAALAVVLVLEAYLGGLVTNHGVDAMIGVHVPLALAIMGLAVWLAARTIRPPR